MLQTHRKLVIIQGKGIASYVFYIAVGSNVGGVGVTTARCVHHSVACCCGGGWQMGLGVGCSFCVVVDATLQHQHSSHMTTLHHMMVNTLAAYGIYALIFKH